MPIGLIILSIALFAMGEKLSDSKKKSFARVAGDVMIFSGLTGMLVGLLGTLFYSAIAVREYLKWPRTIMVYVFTGVFLGLLWLIIYLRNRKIANPMRGLLEVDEQAARSRTSIVA